MKNVFNRKITQIAVDPSYNDAPGLIFALCDDGTLWKKPVYNTNEAEPDVWISVETKDMLYEEERKAG